MRTALAITIAIAATAANASDVNSWTYDHTRDRCMIVTQPDRPGQELIAIVQNRGEPVQFIHASGSPISQFPLYIDFIFPGGEMKSYAYPFDPIRVDGVNMAVFDVDPHTEDNLYDADLIIVDGHIWTTPSDTMWMSFTDCQWNLEHD